MPRNLRIRDFAYDLPDNRIARYPLPERDASKLLLYRDGVITEGVFRNFAGFIPENALLVFNETKVLPARLLYKKETGGIIEIFCLEPDGRYADVTTAMAARGEVYYHCMIGGAAKWKQGQLLRWQQNELILTATPVSRAGGDFLLHFSWNDPQKTFAEILEVFGHVPLPPYLRRSDEPEDKARYQSLLARQEGSVAAPTASLHLSEKVLRDLETKGIAQARLTLHVGAGTFRPVKAETMEGHAMHAEWLEVSRQAIVQLLATPERPKIAIGTTALRTLESLYWMGCKAAQNPGISAEELAVQQWEVYEPAYRQLPPKAALESLLHWLDANSRDRIITKTAILLAPGYSFKMADALVTNFHQPQSTLLLLVAAFIGPDWRKVYDYAVRQDFRFLSYGDGSLLWRSDAGPKTGAGTRSGLWQAKPNA